MVGGIGRGGGSSGGGGGSGGLGGDNDTCFILLFPHVFCSFGHVA